MTDEFTIELDADENVRGKAWADMCRLKTAYAAYAAAADTTDTNDTVEFLEDGTIIDVYLAKKI
tara:strand:- start:123 stop:314 length:192 start_codon:yes stop_codon:yes gene_type:complete